jgi:formylglycine-generating enzyme required for sulfatase activity
MLTANDVLNILKRNWNKLVGQFNRLFYLLKTSLFSLIISLGGCSEKKEDVTMVADYLPFANQKFIDLDPKQLNKLNNRDDLCKIEPGEFLMGSPIEEMGRKSDEVIHLVQITRPFWMKKFEVTNAEWNQFVQPEHQRGEKVFWLSGKILSLVCSSRGYSDGPYSVHQYEEGKSTFFSIDEVQGSKENWRTPSNRRNYRVSDGKFSLLEELHHFLVKQGGRELGRLNQGFPVTRISHSQAVNYCWQRTQSAYKTNEIPSTLIYRLPTEAEWEYSCRAGSTEFCGLGEGNYLSGENANIDGSSRSYILDFRERLSTGGRAFTPYNRRGISEVRPKSPMYPGNRWGLHDMHGNVMEWCFDYYNAYPQDKKMIDPIGPIRGTKKIVRGGSFYRTAQESRSASRAAYEASYMGSEIGFRYVLGFPLR